MIAEATWSDLDVTAPIQNGVRLSAETLSDMIDYLIDHSYVEHTGIIYRQVIGMAMGVHNAPQMANLYCASYELQYVLIRSTCTISQRSNSIRYYVLRWISQRNQATL